jgi:integrase
MALKLSKKNGHWYVEGSLLGTRVRESTRLPDAASYKGMAEKVRLRIEKDIIENHGRPEVQIRTFGDAAAGYLGWRKVEERYNRAMELNVRRFNDDWGEVKLEEITPASIQAYIAATYTSVKPGTVRRNMSYFAAILNWAKENVDGFGGVRVPMPRVDNARDIHFDEDQAVAFLEWVRDAYPHLFGHFLTLIDTGVRLGEMLALRPTNFGDGVLKVRRKLARKSKTLTRDIPMTPDMEVWSDSVRCLGATTPIYWRNGTTGKTWCNMPSVSTTLNRVLKEGCGKMGLPNSGEGAMRVHDLRHTFAYLTAKAGADLGDLQYLMGHSDISMTMRYRGFIQSRARTYVGRARRVLDVA